MKIISDIGETKNLKLHEISKKIPRSNRITAVDQRGHSIDIDSVVECIGGMHKGKRGVVRNVGKNSLFLWDKEFIETNGIFVEQTKNVLIKGHTLINKEGETMSMNRKGRDKLIGQYVIVTKGQYKGCRGRVTDADNTQVILEIPSSRYKVPIDKNCVIPADS